MKKIYLLLLGIFLLLVPACTKKNESHCMKQIRICLRKDPVTLDPRLGNDMVASQLHFMLFEGLIRLDADMTLSPAQAKSYEVSDDGKVYLFHLANNKWSDGSDVTAFDFERSWKKILDPMFPSPDAYLLFQVKNAPLAKKGGCSLDEVEIRAIDAVTLRVELEHPTPHFLQIVASSVLLPVHKSIDDSSSFKEMVGNGPFRLADWKFNQEIIFEKNSFYRESKKVKLNKIIVEIIDRELAALHMYASGHFDLIGAPLSFFPTILHQDLEQKKLINTYPVAITKFLAFNTQTFPFGNTNIRKALSYAINRAAITKNITQFGEKEALDFIPPVLSMQEGSTLPLGADEKRAKKHFKLGVEELDQEIGKIPFMYVQSEINHILAQELQSQWSKILGLKIDLHPVDFRTLHEKSAKSDYSVGLFSLLADYADPMNVLERFQDKKNHRNYSKWENESYNQLIKKALVASSKSDYDSLIKEAEQVLMEEMPVAGLYHENYIFLIHPLPCFSLDLHRGKG